MEKYKYETTLWIYAITLAFIILIINFIFPVDRYLISKICACNSGKSVDIYVDGIQKTLTCNSEEKERIFFPMTATGGDTYSIYYRIDDEDDVKKINKIKEKLIIMEE